jgi:TolA-binding protein
MKVERPFKPVGRRLENLNNLIQTKYPQDKWVLDPILPIFLSIIDSSSTIEQQEKVIDLLNRVFDDYEFRYNTILETITMTQETLRMQFLSGVITESEYKTKLEELNTPSEKDSLNENFIGIGAINNPFADRTKETYEDAFEHFLSQKYSLNEVEEVNEEEEEEDLEEGKEVEEPNNY